MTRSTARLGVLLVTLVGLLGLLAGPAWSQAVDPFVDDLRGNDVTFEDGAAGDELQAVADVAADLSVPGAFYKVVILGAPVDSFASEREFAEEVLRGLGGTGRLQVNSPAGVGLASNVDPTEEVRRAEDAATFALGQFGNEASVLAAGDVLGFPDEVGDVGVADGDSSGSSWLRWVVVGLLIMGGIAFFLWFVSRGKTGTGQAPTTVDLAAQKVRNEVDRAANLIIELNDAQNLPGFTDEAKSWFREGATQFAELQDDLEEADTRAELEAVWPALTHCTWKLAGAKELAAGRPAPAPSAPEPLIPQTTVFGTPPAGPVLGAPPAAPLPGSPLPPPSVPPPPPPGAGYQQQSRNPWLTQTAATALTMLAAQGIGNASRTRSGRSRRPPSDDGWFGSVFGGGGGPRMRSGSSRSYGSRSSSGSRSRSSGSRSRSSGGGRSGRVGRGVGRRR